MWSLAWDFWFEESETQEGPVGNAVQSAGIAHVSLFSLSCRSLVLMKNEGEIFLSFPKTKTLPGNGFPAPRADFSLSFLPMIGKPFCRCESGWFGSGVSPSVWPGAVHGMRETRVEVGVRIGGETGSTVQS